MKKINTIRKKKKGFTLVELIAAMALLTIVFLFAGSAIVGGSKMYTSGVGSANAQSDMRTAATLVSDAIRESVAIFVLPQASFDKVRSKTTGDGWDYFGMEPLMDGSRQVGSQLVWYYYIPDEADPTKGIHDRRVLMETSEGVLLYLDFNMSNPDKTGALSFKMEAALDRNASVPYQTIESELTALNTLQVVNWSAGADPGAAIAFRRGDRPLPKVIPAANVAIVLDVSGSMDRIAEGTKKKSQYLAEATRILLDKLCDNEFINLSVVLYNDFGFHAFDPNKVKTIPKEMMSAKEFASPANQFDDIVIDLCTKIPKQKTDGHTNGGDALRLAYHDVKKQSAIEPDVKNYVIFMTDGEFDYLCLSSKGDSWVPGKNYPTYYGKMYSGSEEIGYYSEYSAFLEPKEAIPEYFTHGVTPGDVKSIILPGNTTPTSITPGADYAAAIAQDLLYKIPKGGSSSEMVYVEPMLVGFLEGADGGFKNTLGVLCSPQVMNIKPENYYGAEDGEELVKAFTEIGERILKDSWHINGPEL